MLLAMKHAYPGKYPLSDRFNQPHPRRQLPRHLSAAYGTARRLGLPGFHQWRLLGRQLRQPTCSPARCPSTRRWSSSLNELYNQGLIDPESFTQADTIALQKLTSGKSFVISENAQMVVTDQAALPSGATIVKAPGAGSARSGRRSPRMPPAGSRWGS